VRKADSIIQTVLEWKCSRQILLTSGTAPVPLPIRASARYLATCDAAWKDLTWFSRSHTMRGGVFDEFRVTKGFFVMNRRFLVFTLAALGLLGAGPAFAQQPTASAANSAEKPKDDKDKDKDKKPEEKIVTSKHTVRIGGQEIKYTATAGTILLKQEDGTPKASIFYVAYTKDDVSDVSQRPISFTFNGGPGSASVWLHLGAFGPRRVQMGDAGTLLPPPYKLVDNESSLLDVADLVFIDPVSTGYSRAVPGEPAKQFHGVEEDVESVGEFIRLYATRNKRWSSPKFLAGESYGTTRAAGLSNYMQQRFGMYFNGIILISTILNFETAEFNIGNDLPCSLYLPTYSAIAWYHKKLPQDLQSQDVTKVIEESRRFAAGEYADALMQGDALSDAKRTEIAQKVGRLTGLSAAYVERTNLCVEIQRFTKELLRDERRTVGRIDGRFTGIDRDAAGETPEYDPSIAAIMGPYAGMLNDYVRNELKFDSDLPYEILTGRVRPWNYAPYENRYVNVAEKLRIAMTENPFLHVFVAKGYYDLATPFFAADYTFDHLGLDPSLRSHLSGDYYETGHMTYVQLGALAKMKQDLVKFINDSVPPANAMPKTK
jgi:carboxypeptidase C (cathepsin A)